MNTKGKLIGQGNTAEVYDYAPDKILKLYRKGMPDEACEAEFYVNQNVNRQLNICPNAYELVRVEGRIGGIYEKIAGKTLLSQMISKIWLVKKESKLLAQYHINIQKEVDFELPTVQEKLKDNISTVSELSSDEKEKLYKYIDSLPQGKTLCHFDFHPGNIIINPNRVVIIDWMTACIGDCLADVARIGIMLKYAEVPIKSLLLRKLIKKLQNTIYNNYIKEYLKITNTKIEDIQKWEYPIAAARLCEWVPKNEKKILINFVKQYAMY